MGEAEIDRLRARAYSQALHHKIADFDCGNEPWQTDVGRWIREEALNWLGPTCQIWLYENASGATVGFGSLGSTTWAGVPLSIIPYLGVRREFWHKPESSDWNDRYGYQILDDLIARAVATRDERRLLGLFVHEQNHAARKMYERKNFQPFGQPLRDRDIGGYKLRLTLDLHTVDVS